MEYHVTELLYYPVKSMGAISVAEIELDRFGLRNDRRFMLIDQNNKFVSQRTHPRLALLMAGLESQHLVVSGSETGPLVFPYDAFLHDTKVEIWSDTVAVKLIDAKYTDTLSQWLGMPVRMVYMPDTALRQVDRQFYAQDQNVSFADAFPFLLTNMASLGDLNSRLERPVPMSRFRPNIVFDGDQPFQEDEWRNIKIGELAFELVKPCSRCGMTTVNEYGNSAGKEPLKTLAKYRKNEFGVCFGQNMVHRSFGKIRVGDTLSIGRQ